LKGFLNLRNIILNYEFGANVGMAVELYRISTYKMDLGRYLGVACVRKIPGKGDPKKKNHSSHIPNGSGMT